MFRGSIIILIVTQLHIYIYSQYFRHANVTLLL